jgi:hypothetical protein
VRDFNLDLNFFLHCRHERHVIGRHTLHHDVFQFHLELGAFFHFDFKTRRKHWAIVFNK